MKIIKKLLIAVSILIITSCSSAGKAKPYALKTCIVSDNELGSMGDPVSFVYKGQEYKVCCKPCIKKFKKNPDKYLNKVK